MGEIINFLDKRANSKYGRNPLEHRFAVSPGIASTKLLIDEGKEISGNILNVSAGGLALAVDALDFDIERGLEVERVTIETTDGRIFEAGGLVTHVTPEIKEKEFTHRLGLGFKRKESPTLDKLSISKTDRQFDILSKDEEMAKIIEDLVLIGDEAKIGIKLDAHTDVYGRFNKKSDLKKIKSFNIDFEDESHCMAFEVEKEFTFFFTLFRTFYIFRSMVLSNIGKSIEIAIPDFFVKLMRRDTTRIRFNGSETAYITIKHPFRSGLAVRKPVIDMNEKGLSIELSKDDTIFPVGISLREMEIEIPGAEPIKTLGRLVHIEPTAGENYKCGIKLFERDEKKLKPVTDFVFFKRFPLLFYPGKKDYEKIWELFDKSGYLDEKPRESFELVREDSNPTWVKLDSSKNSFSRNIATTEGEKITGGMHLSRMFSNAWLLHHFCILPGHQRTVATTIYGGTIDQLQAAKAEYLVCYYNADKAWNQKNYGEFIAQHPFKEENYTKTYDLFEFDLTKQNFDSSRAVNGLTIRSANDFDTKSIARFFEMNREKIQIEAMDLSLSKIQLTQLKEEAANYGIERGRQFFVAKKGKEIVGFSMLEIATTGINIYALMDSFRVYIIDPQNPKRENIIKSLVTKSLEYFKSINKKTVLYFSNDKDISFLSPIQFHRLCTIELWIAHRNSYVRQIYHTAAIFGRILARRKRVHAKIQQEGQ